VTVTGLLAAAGEHRLRADGSNVYLRVDGPPSVPVCARVRMGDGPGAHAAAQALAGQCRRGDSVTLTGTVVYPRTDHDFAAVILTGVTAMVLNGAPVVLR
jgi:hypothetical protein